MFLKNIKAVLTPKKCEKSKKCPQKKFKQGTAQQHQWTNKSNCHPFEKIQKHGIS